MQEELHVTPQEHSDFVQSTAVLWWLECELDFWLGELSPSYEALRPEWPLPSIHLAEIQDAEALGVAASLLYQGFQDAHKGKPAPRG